MATQTFRYCSNLPLYCGACPPADIILCIPSSLQVNGLDYIYATITATIKKCSGLLTYEYVIEYDDTQLVPDTLLTSSDINGATCRNCLTDWVESLVENVEQNLILPNNVYLEGRNFGDTADVGLIRIDASDNTEVNADAGNLVEITVGGVIQASFGSPSEVILYEDGALIRRDVDSDSLKLIGGTAAATANGSYIELHGDTSAGAGRIDIIAGNNATSHIFNKLNNVATYWQVFSTANVEIASVSDAGNLYIANDISVNAGSITIAGVNKGLFHTGTAGLLILGGGSDGGSSTGAYLQLAGNTNGSLGAFFLGGGAVASGHLNITIGHASALIKLQGTGGNLIQLSNAGSIILDRTNTAGGTTGAQVINKMAGSVNFAIGAAALVVTNSLVSATSNIIAVAQTNDGTGYVKNVVPGAGSFTINLVAAATAETRVAFWVTN